MENLAAIREISQPPAPECAGCGWTASVLFAHLLRAVATLRRSPQGRAILGAGDPTAGLPLPTIAEAEHMATVLGLLERVPSREGRLAVMGLAQGLNASAVARAMGSEENWRKSAHRFAHQQLDALAARLAADGVPVPALPVPVVVRGRKR